MKLNKQSKDELRKEIIEQLKKVPNGQRVQLDKDLLEDLLFEVVTLDKEKDIKVKLPIWSGEFLKKIDLSQVDYTNVSWGMLGGGEDYIEEIIYFDLCDVGIEIDTTTMSILKKIEKDNSECRQLPDGFAIDYAGTNARIDLSKSFEAIYENSLSIVDCNFAMIDFSKQDLTNIKRIFVYSSNLYETKLPIANIDLDAWGSDFTGIDLSTKKIDGLEYLLNEYDSLGVCTLTDCGVQITLDREKFEQFKNRKSNQDIEVMEGLQHAMNEEWVGCYVNGKKVLSLKERRANATEKKEEYDKMKGDIFNSTIESIKEQVSHMKR